MFAGNPLENHYKPTAAVLMDVCEKTRKVQLDSRWADALEAQGLGVIRVFPGEDRRDLENILNKVDGIFLPGGNTNVHASIYGQEQKSCAEIFGDCSEIATPDSANRDWTAMILVQEAQRRKIPFLGVCRGMQEMNVALGGSLQQRLQGHDQGYQKGADWTEPVHDIDVVSGAPLHHAFGRAGLVKQTSIHRQGMYKSDLAPDVEIAAMADDGKVVEAIYVPGHPHMMGVQFHAELDEKQPLNAKIFESYADAVHRFAFGRLNPVQEVVAAIAAE